MEVGRTELLSDFQVSIIERSSGQLREGVVRGATHSDKVLWTHWHGEMPAGAEDAHWDWDQLIDLALAMPNRFEVYALEAEGQIQGFRLLEISENEVEEYGVHALRLSTAPWNRPPERRYFGVGSILVAVAIQRSMDFGHRGCVHCESLPGAEMFHERNGMVELASRSGEELRRYRFTEEAATAFVDRLRNDGLIQ